VIETALPGAFFEGALGTASVAQLSRPGVEAGDREVTSDGTDVYAVWQEIPGAWGSRPELRVARLGPPPEGQSRRFFRMNHTRPPAMRRQRAQNVA